LFSVKASQQKRNTFLAKYAKKKKPNTFLAKYAKNRWYVAKNLARLLHKT
jgi:hypothetical protein